MSAARCQQRRGVRAPRAECRCTDFPLLLETAAGEQILERFVGVLGGRSDASAHLQVTDLTCCGGLGPDLRKDFAGFGRLAPGEQDVDERYAAVKARQTGVLERARRI